MKIFTKSETLLCLVFSAEARLRHILSAIWQSLGLLTVLIFLMPYTCQFSSSQCEQILNAPAATWLPLWWGINPSVLSVLWQILLLTLAAWLFKQLVLNILHGMFRTELVFEHHRLYWYIPALSICTKSIDLKKIAYIDVYDKNIEQVLEQAPLNMILRTHFLSWPLLVYQPRDFTNSHSASHSLPILILLYCPNLTCRFFDQQS